MFIFDWQALIKYLLEGLGVALAAFYIPHKNLTFNEIILIALTAAATFALLDQFSPGVAAGARQGTGFGIGLQVSGTQLGSLFATNNMLGGGSYEDEQRSYNTKPENSTSQRIASTEGGQDIDTESTTESLD